MERTIPKNNISLKARVQKLGSTLSSMVMPNIGALIAWGVLTALFIPDGYLPNEAFATMVSPMLTYLIPLLIGYTGGKVIAGDRGSVVGAIATMGVIVGTDIPMMLGAMIMDLLVDMPSRNLISCSKNGSNPVLKCWSIIFQQVLSVLD